MTALNWTTLTRAAAGACLLGLATRSTFALPPINVPVGANYAQALYACETQCTSHVPPGISPQQAAAYCPGRCQQMLHYEPAVINPPGTTGSGGISNCLLSEIGNWGFYGACQIIWSVTTSGLGSVTSLVASILGGNSQLAQQLVNAAKGAANPCGYLKMQLDAELAQQCQ